jgi:hypothetical protein
MKAQEAGPTSFLTSLSLSKPLPLTLAFTKHDTLEMMKPGRKLESSAENFIVSDEHQRS